MNKKIADDWLSEIHDDAIEQFFEIRLLDSCLTPTDLCDVIVHMISNKNLALDNFAQLVKKYLSLCSDQKKRLNNVHWWFLCCIENNFWSDYYSPIFNKYQNILDSHFGSQIKIDPFSRLYELYIANNLSSTSFVLTRPNSTGGSDFVDSENGVIFECAVPCIGDSIISHSSNNEQDWGPIDEDKKKLRYASCLKEKIKQYEKIGSDYPLVICICGSKLEAGERNGGEGQYDSEYSVLYSDLGTFSDPVYQLLYGKQEVIVADKFGAKLAVVDSKNMIKNGNNVADIHGVFRYEDCQKISAIIFTPYDGIIMDQKKYKSFLYLNKNAIKPINDACIKKLQSFCQIIK